MGRVLITGGTGLLGGRITQLLQDQGTGVAYLSRRPDYVARIPAYEWDVNAQKIDADCLKDTGAIIHLAGAGVADRRWSAERKEEILQSRTRSTALLYKLLKENPHSVHTVVCASAIGYYGYDNGEWKDENSAPASDFLADVTKAWEDAEDRLAELGVRVVKIRIGIVLTREGGALKELAKPIQWWAGAPLGSGDQYMSWIHIDDVTRIFLYALENDSLSGAYNAAAPNPVTNAVFTKAVAKTLNKPLLLPNVPPFAMRMLVGEMAEMLLGGSRVSSEKIRDAGFVFNFPHLEEALEDLLRQN
ncbi:TIGR01777 family oxidoreductase [Fulvivirga sedimenti]